MLFTCEKIVALWNFATSLRSLRFQYPGVGIKLQIKTNPNRKARKEVAKVPKKLFQATRGFLFRHQRRSNNVIVNALRPTSSNLYTNLLVGRNI